MAGTYTQQNIDSARSVFGDDPSAVARGVASTMTQSPTFQEPIQGQAGAIDALQQIKDYDMQLAGKVNQGNTAQMQAGQAQTQQLAQYGAAGATPQETIIKAQAALPATEMRQPTVGLLSPFVASGLASGQTKAATDTYDIAAQTRAALTQAVGSESANYASAIKAENERKRQEEERKIAQEERKLDLIQAFGGDYAFEGKTYHFDTPEEKAEKARKAEKSVLYRTGISGKSLLQEVVDGSGNFIDVIRENPDLTDEEITALGRANVSKFGAFKESNQELRRLGLGSLVDAGLTREGATTTLDKDKLSNANTLRDEYVKQSGDFDKISSSYSKILSADPSPAGDMSLIFGYMKLLDPGSTVREGEYANAENSAGIPERVKVAYNKALAGEKLGDSQRTDFKKQAENVYNSASTRHEQTKKEYNRLAIESGIDPSLVIVDFGTVKAPETIRVKDKKTGKTGTIPMNEFNESIYERI